jgi:signal peptidase I
MFTVAILVGMVVASFLCGALFLWLAARLCRVPKAGFARALLGMLLLTALSMLDLAILGSPRPLLAAVLGLLILRPLNWALVAIVFQTSFPRAILVSVIWVAGGIAFSVGLVISVKAFVLEAYFIPTNSMSPTLVGPHHRAACTHCGKDLVVPPLDDLAPVEEQEAICSQCLKMSKVTKWDPELLPPDRLICNKLYSPRRWDLIVFRHPKDPTVKYVDRLIGLPGEEVVIKEGAVWINGARMEPPPEIAGLEFTDGIEFMKGWGSKEDPARLGPEESYVLGDFAHRSSDSRFWKPCPGPTSKA